VLSVEETLDGRFLTVAFNYVDLGWLPSDDFFGVYPTLFRDNPVPEPTINSDESSCSRAVFVPPVQRCLRSAGNGVERKRRSMED
jgi:hypothetical protein